MDGKKSRKKYRLRSRMAQDAYMANIFDAKFVNEHFTNFSDEI